MESTAPDLSLQMRWAQTSGQEGTPPSLRSTLIRDHGPVMRYDFAGANESYLHLLQISGAYNYRWGDGGGVLYYGAKNRAWSYNGNEDNGDQFDFNKVTSFSVNGKGLERNATDQPLYDFDFAQFYRAVADPVTAAMTGYRSRGLMMLRDDFIALYDEDDPGVSGQFTWVTQSDFPQIYQLLPGADFESDSTSEVNIRRYRGVGDFFTIVAPEPLSADATAYGALVNQSEYVFFSQLPLGYSDGTASFTGKAGYARPSQLALFEGAQVQLADFQVRRSSGDFGLSAAVTDSGISGRIAGRAGGHACVTPPSGFDPTQGQVAISGVPVPSSIEDGAVCFDVNVSLGDGYRNYSITF